MLLLDRFFCCCSSFSFGNLNAAAPPSGLSCVPLLDHQLSTSFFSVRGESLFLGYRDFCLCIWLSAAWCLIYGSLCIYSTRDLLSFLKPLMFFIKFGKFSTIIYWNPFSASFSGNPITPLLELFTLSCGSVKVLCFHSFVVVLQIGWFFLTFFFVQVVSTPSVGSI